jgi:hypothetical protein
MTIDGPASIVLTVVGIAICFAGVAASTGISGFDRRGRRRTAVCAALVAIGSATMWAASSAGFAA